MQANDLHRFLFPQNNSFFLWVLELCPHAISRPKVAIFTFTDPKCGALWPPLWRTRTINRFSMRILPFPLNSHFTWNNKNVMARESKSCVLWIDGGCLLRAGGKQSGHPFAGHGHFSSDLHHITRASRRWSNVVKTIYDRSTSCQLGRRIFSRTLNPAEWGRRWNKMRTWWGN